MQRSGRAHVLALRPLCRLGSGRSGLVGSVGLVDRVCLVGQVGLIEPVGRVCQIGQVGPVGQVFLVAQLKRCIEGDVAIRR